MLPEALVIFACTHGSGCTETSNLYFDQNPAVKQQIDITEKNAKDYIGPKVVDIVGPALFVVSGGTGTIHVTKHFNLLINKQMGKMEFQWDL